MRSIFEGDDAGACAAFFALPRSRHEGPPGNYAGSLYPESQLLLRYCSALEEKLGKIDGYVAKGLVATIGHRA